MAQLEEGKNARVWLTSVCTCQNREVELVI